MEGAEWLILDDLKQQVPLLKNIRQLVLEYHHKINQEPSRLTSFLGFFEHNGFEYNIRANYKNEGDFQDLVLNFYRV